MGDLGKTIVAIGFAKIAQMQKIAQPGHTGYLLKSGKYLKSMKQWRIDRKREMQRTNVKNKV